MKVHILLCLFLGLFSLSANAQVTIGSDADPHIGSLLHLKETESNEDNSTKGFLYPRVALENPHFLRPLVADTEATPEIKKQATGTMVFNTTVNQSQSLNLGVYLWNGTQWVLVVSAIGDAKYDTITKNNIVVNGTYYKNKVLTEQNSLTITFNVTIPGTYKITATTANGYSFITSGEFHTTGEQIVSVKGTGTPINSTADNNNNLDIISVQIGCDAPVTKENTVLGIPSAYTINCATATYHGGYVPNVPLTTSNYLTVKVNSKPTATGGVYNIYTDLINGYSFEGTGVLTGESNQTIYLYPTSNKKPEKAGVDYFTINTNSTTSKTECFVSIPVIGATLSLQSIGNYQNTENNLLSMRDNTDYFSPAGIYKVQELSVNSVGASSGNPTLSTEYDGIFFSYNTYLSEKNKQNAIDYINAGKTLIYAIDGTGINETVSTDTRVKGLVAVLKSIFGVDGSKILLWSHLSEDATFVDSDNPIIKGPFGNLAGKTLERNGSSNFSIKIEHPDFVPVANTSNGYSRVFYHKTKNLLVICDGAPFGASIADDATLKIFLANIIAWIGDNRYKINESIPL